MMPFFVVLNLGVTNANALTGMERILMYKAIPVKQNGLVELWENEDILQP